MTEQVGHTPGPWKVGYHAMDVMAEDAKGAFKICDIRGWGHLTGKGHGALGLPQEEAKAIQEANASLIAAAPDMKSELEQSRRDVKILLTQIRYIGEATGAWPEGEDRAIFDHIETIYCLESPALLKAQGQPPSPERKET